MGKGLILAKWESLSLEKKFIIFSNEKSSLIQIPNSNYRFWYPNKILKQISSNSYVSLLYTADIEFRIFKSKKLAGKWENYNEKTIKIQELKSLITDKNTLNINCRKKNVIYKNKKSYLISYVDLEYNYVKFWISNRSCEEKDKYLIVSLCEDEYQLVIKKSDFETIEKTVNAYDLYNDFNESEFQVNYDKTKKPSRLKIPRNVTVNQTLKDNYDYDETGVLQTKTNLFLHQQKAVAKVLTARYNALFMDMGTGKTRTAIELLKIRQNKYNKMFWFTPVSLKYSVYLEFLKHTNLTEKDIYLFDQKTTDKTKIKQKFIIVGIESLASSDRTYLALNAMIQGNSFIVVDESSFIKGYSKRTKRIIQLTKDTIYRTILTGTPISQGIVDLYSQMYFLSPKILDYRNFYQFAKNHLQYHKKIQGMIINEYNEDYIAAKINPYVYQVTKEECLNLKEKNYIDRYFEMGEKQKKIYEQIKEDFFENFISYEEDSIFLLFNKLQQIISGFQYTENKEINIINTVRADFLEEIIKEIDKQYKIIIWAKYRADIEIIESVMIKKFKDNNYVIFDGSKSEAEKAVALNEFKHNANTRFFIATQATGAFGLNLAEANYTIFYNNGFKYSERMQSEDRNYRIGQNKPVTYIDIICSNSIDIKINNTLRLKENIASSFRKDLEKIKDKKLKKSLLNAILDGNLDKANKIIEEAELSQKNTTAKRMEKMRRKRGVIPRKEYLENSITKKSPWKELNISRATWYRRLNKDET